METFIIESNGTRQVYFLIEDMLDVLRYDLENTMENGEDNSFKIYSKHMTKEEVDKLPVSELYHK